MSESEPERRCKECGKPLDPDSEGVIGAVEVKCVDTFRGPLWLDGVRVFFHEDCFPYGSGDFRTIG